MKLLFQSLSMILPASLLLPGCFQCGGYDGGGDVMYRRGDDVLYLCDNGGFTLTFGGKTIIEGHHLLTRDGLAGANGETGAREFSLQAAGDGTWTSPELGPGWAEVALDKTALDHGDVQCQGLTTRAWWLASQDGLPVTTVFSKPTGGFASIADCQAAQHAGAYPAAARCEDSVVLCPDGRLATTSYLGIEKGNYSAGGGAIDALSANRELQGIYAADGTLHSGSDVWHQVPVDQADPALVAAARCGAGV